MFRGKLNVIKNKVVFLVKKLTNGDSGLYDLVNFTIIKYLLKSDRPKKRTFYCQCTSTSRRTLLYSLDFSPHHVAQHAFGDFFRVALFFQRKMEINNARIVN